MCALALGAVSTPFAQPRVLWDLHSCEALSEGSSAGTVESVREVAVTNDLHAFDPGVLEHTVRPETTEELAVRLDSGPVVIFMHKVSPGFRAGQRVRVVLAGGTARVDPDLPRCSSVFAALP
jgi:outer membrane lipoprotein SlyB